MRGASFVALLLPRSVKLRQLEMSFLGLVRAGKLAWRHIKWKYLESAWSPSAVGAARIIVVAANACDIAAFLLGLGREVACATRKERRLYVCKGAQIPNEYRRVRPA